MMIQGNRRRSNLHIWFKRAFLHSIFFHISFQLLPFLHSLISFVEQPIKTLIHLLVRSSFFSCIHFFHQFLMLHHFSLLKSRRFIIVESLQLNFSVFIVKCSIGIHRAHSELMLLFELLFSFAYESLCFLVCEFLLCFLVRSSLNIIAHCRFHIAC